MDYTINAIETDYMGYKFRSRLEAKWAAFFTIAGWRWEYEPVDFSGWIPDFAIYGKDVVYVEVKPVVDFPEDVAKKIDSSGCEKEVLILGTTSPITGSQLGDNTTTIGWLREGGWWDESPMGRWTEGYGAWGFCYMAGDYTDRMSGGYDGGCYGDYGDYLDNEHEAIRRMWAEACNKVRWEKGATK